MLVPLPTELLREIASYLPTSASTSLKLVSKRLYNTIPVPADYDLHKLSQCERNAVRRAINEHKHLQSGRRWCIVCNTLQPLRCFSDGGAICSMHDGRLVRDGPPPGLEACMKTRLKQLAKVAQEAHWVSIPRTLCKHCHTIYDWDTSRCCCSCDSCAQVVVECLVRIAGKLDSPTSWELSGAVKCERFVCEEWVPSCKSTFGKPSTRADADGLPVLSESTRTFHRKVAILTLDQAERSYDIA